MSTDPYEEKLVQSIDCAFTTLVFDHDSIDAGRVMSKLDRLGQAAEQLENLGLDQDWEGETDLSETTVEAA
jgi:hypothetical protein